MVNPILKLLRNSTRQSWVGISATARQLTVIIWNMIVKNIPYKSENYLYLDEKRKQGLVKRMKKSVEKFKLKPEDFNFSTC
jgi:transposase